MLALNKDELRIVAQKLKIREIIDLSQTCHDLHSKISKIYLDKSFWISQNKQLEILKHHPHVDWKVAGYYTGLPIDQQLIRSAQRGDLWFLKTVLIKQYIGLTIYECLRIAAIEGHIHIIKWIFWKYSQFLSRNILSTIFYNVIKGDNLDSILYLRKRGVYLNQPLREIETALFHNAWKTFCYLRQEELGDFNSWGADIMSWYLEMQDPLFSTYFYCLVQSFIIGGLFFLVLGAAL